MSPMDAEFQRGAALEDASDVPEFKEAKFIKKDQPYSGRYRQNMSSATPQKKIKKNAGANYNTEKSKSTLKTRPKSSMMTSQRKSRQNQAQL